MLIPWIPVSLISSNRLSGSPQPKSFLLIGSRSGLGADCLWGVKTSSEDSIFCIVSLNLDDQGLMKWVHRNWLISGLERSLGWLECLQTENCWEHAFGPVDHMASAFFCGSEPGWPERGSKNCLAFSWATQIWFILATFCSQGGQLYT